MKDFEVRIHPVIDDNFELLFLVDEEVVGSAIAEMNSGEVGAIIISGDLNNDDKVDTSDEQIIRDIAVAVSKIKWSQS
jgi:hypothetical protein